MAEGPSASRQIMQSSKLFFALVLLGALCTHATAQVGFGAQGMESEPEPHAAMAGTVARPGQRGAGRVVSPARRWPFPLGPDRACLNSKRAASRANAPARIPRFGGMAGGTGLCCARADTAGAMASPAESISKTRAAAMKPITHAPGARQQSRWRGRLRIYAGNPLCGRTAR